jgi:iron complex transport system ATP-binding protein
MARPRLLILDEPCAGLDPVAREKFLNFLDRLARKRGAPALVLVTHHVEEITPAFTHALLLRGGRVVAAGPRARLLTSRHLSATFGAPLRLTHTRGRYQLAFTRP